jgi:site-specific recombinase XerD
MTTLTRLAEAATATAEDDDFAYHVSAFRRTLRSRNRSPLTITAYDKALAQFYAFLTESGRTRLVTGIKRDDIEAWIEYLQNKTERLVNGTPRAAGFGEDGRLSDATVAQRWRSISVFFHYLHRTSEAILVDPTARMDPPKIGRKNVPVVPRSDLARLLEQSAGRTFADKRDTAILYILFKTGARLSEIANIKIGDLRLDEDPPRVLVHGKGNQERLVTFGDEAAQILDRYLSIRRRIPGDFGDRLWLGERGPRNSAGPGPLGSSGIAQMLRRRARAAGIALHAHQLRHSFASDWLMAGGSETDLVEQMGWADASATIMLRRYGRAAAADRAHKHYNKYAPSLKGPTAR